MRCISLSTVWGKRPLGRGALTIEILSHILKALAGTPHLPQGGSDLKEEGE